MGMTKVARQGEVPNGNGKFVVKELFGKFFILSVTGNGPTCCETAEAPRPRSDGGLDFPSPSKNVPLYVDVDGAIWMNYQVEARPSVQIGAGFGLGQHFGQLAMDTNAPLNIAPPPEPLAPWAGRDMKPMPPSPLLSHKQAKHIDVDAGKGASRKVNFGSAESGQKQISDYFTSGVAIAPMDF